MKFIDLFSGIGGFHNALKPHHNNQCVFACDIDKDCRQVYENNFKLTPHSDITKVEIDKIPQFDILCGGFPCQSFSNAGNRKGLEDPRGTLFDNVLKIIKFHKPKFCILENVKHLKTINEGSIYNYIMESLRGEGYIVHTRILSPHDINIPQLRYRLIFMVVRNDLVTTVSHEDFYKKLDFHFDNEVEIHANKNKNYKIFDEPEYVDFEKTRIPDDIKLVLLTWDSLIKKLPVGTNISFPLIQEYFTLNFETLGYIPKWKKDYIIKNNNFYNEFKEIVDSWWENNSCILTKRKNYSKLEWQVGIIKENDTITNYYVQVRQSGIRVRKNKYFPTLVAITQTPIYTKEMRYLSVRECARLQNVPETFEFLENDSKSLKQLGNSVCVGVMEIAYLAICKVLGITEKRKPKPKNKTKK